MESIILKGIMVVMMNKFKFDLAKTVDNFGVIGKGILRSNQAAGLLMPEILCVVRGYKIVKRNDGITVVSDEDGNLYKIFYGVKNKFNIAPSWAKGVGRSKKGITSFKYHLNKVSNSCIFIKRVGNICYAVIIDNDKLIHDSEGDVNLLGHFNE